MASYLLRRLLAIVPILLLVTVIVFALMHVLPGDPARTILGMDASPAAVQALRERLGLNRPLHVQYLSWVGGVVRGDLGRSLVDNTPVARAIASAFPVTLQITILSLLIALAIGVPAGIISATKRGGILDAAATFAGLSGISMPAFWVAMLLIYAFSLHLGWLPSSGFVRPQDDLLRSLSHSLLPAFALGLRPAGIFMRLVRSSMLEVLKSDYVRTARSKGLSAIAVVLRHALRLALMPLVTILGVEFAATLGNVIVIDTIFSIPGFGRLIYSSFLRFDFVMMQSLVLMFALMVMVINLLTDLTYTVIDPRIRY
jgi:peptide/nickel transport system permease protein